jgi:hypothetical protein
MPLLIDKVAKEIALRRWALPEYLHVPVAAVDEVAISGYIGEIQKILIGRSPPSALLVKVTARSILDSALPISKIASSEIFHRPLQVWVHVNYNGYRRAYRKAFPNEDINGKARRAEQRSVFRHSSGLPGALRFAIAPYSLLAFTFAFLAAASWRSSAVISIASSRCANAM